MTSSGQLSEDQVAALVVAARDGQLADSPAAAVSRRRRVRKIDFTRPSKFTTEQQRRLERAHDNFCRSVSTRMSADLRTAISFELIDTAQLTWANALEEVPRQSVSGIIDVTPLDGRMVLTAELTFLLGLLERLLGGQGLDRPAERHLTDVDRALTRRIFQTLLDELSISFNDVADLRFELLDLETERTPAQLAPLSEPSLAMTFEVKLGRASSTMVLLIPHRAIESVLRTPEPAESDVELAAGAAAAVGDAMGDVVVQLRAEVGSVDMSLERVLALRPGDVLRLDGATEEGSVTLFADSVGLQRCKLGRNGRHRAVGVLGPVDVQP
ncbi:MAG: flagellar motor switch protein FliM [Solirubrobacteraceae bacterium]|jgi:flagellar motor switch protein FliM|nr:flagellar motor switch protein FliM [Solirubrobacteraceae bacterium]MEA2242469.1 flagellar motor switch protein FliM [Solirubrobacteraceae bacterium]